MKRLTCNKYSECLKLQFIAVAAFWDALPAEYISPAKVALNFMRSFMTSSLHSASISENILKANLRLKIEPNTGGFRKFSREPSKKVLFGWFLGAGDAKRSLIFGS